MRKYVVTISKSYIDIEFAFNSMEEAGIFIETALNAYRKDDDHDIKAFVEIVNEADAEITEKEEK